MKEFWQLYLQEWHRIEMQNGGCMPTMMYGFIIAALIICTLCGCKTTTSSEQTIDYRHMARISEKMDSLIHSTATWQQSIYDKQTSLVDSFKSSEVRDTSHVIFLGSKGDTVREVITIYKERIIEHTTDSKESENWQEMYYKTDSMLQSIIFCQEKTDSILNSHNKETVVEKQPSLGDKLKWFAGGVVLSIICCIAICPAFMKKSS